MLKSIKVLLIILVMSMVAGVKASAQFWGNDIITFSGGGNFFIPVGEKNSIVSAPATGGVFGIGTTLEGFHEMHKQELMLNYAFALSGKRKVGEIPNSYKLHTAFLSWYYSPISIQINGQLVSPYIGANVGWGQTVISTHGTPSGTMKSNNFYWAPKIGVQMGPMDLGVRYDFLGQNKGVGVDLSVKLALLSVN